MYHIQNNEDAESEATAEWENKLDSLELRLSSLKHHTPFPTATKLPSSNSGATASEMDTIRAVTNLLATKVISLEEGRNPKKVHYGGMLFESPLELGAWLLLVNMEVEDAGLIVDPHTVMEHVFGTINDEDFLKTFKKLHKLQISNLSQGFMISSFQQSVPKYFCLNKLSEGFFFVLGSYCHVGRLGQSRYWPLSYVEG